MDDLERRVDSAADLVDALVFEANRSQREDYVPLQVSSLEKSLIAHYDICKFNGASTTEFQREICYYGKFKLLKPAMPAGCFALPLGVSTSVLGVFLGSYQLFAVGSVISLVSIPVSFYSVKSKLKERAKVVNALFDIEANRYILDGALKKLRDEK